MDSQSVEQRTLQRRTFWLSVVGVLVALSTLVWNIYSGSRKTRDTNGRFDKVETALRILTQTAAPQIYKSVNDSLNSALVEPTTAATGSIRLAQAALKQLRQADVPPNVESLKNDGLTLSRVADAHTNVPEVWQVAGELVSYKSQGIVQDSRKLLVAELPDCADQQPSNPVVTAANPNQFSVKLSEYQDCRFTLDSDKDAEAIKQVLTTKSFQVGFKHCLIVYRGGEVKFPLFWKNWPVSVTDGVRSSPMPPYTGPALAFENCVFDFRLSGEPPAVGRDVTRRLLADNNLSFTSPPNS